MDEDAPFPDYIPRLEEKRIRQAAAQVKKDRRSRAVLLYGPGGAGKTSLIRELARTATDDTTIWLEPIDVDDSEYWLLSSLERRIADGLDPGGVYFRRYVDEISRFPQYTQERIGHETVLSHLRRIKRVFIECYGDYIQASGKTVVIALDTVEAIRGTYLLLTLTQWMKALPGTLFILTGRPLANGDRQDSIQRELKDPHQPLPVQVVRLAGFSQAAGLRYLERSTVATGLSAQEKRKLVRLTRGHPLWLALAIDYLTNVGVPEEAERNSLTRIRRDVPYKGTMNRDGKRLHEAFKRRLVTPYRETDFWHEAIKRLAVVRQSVNQSIWQQLMSDCKLPDGTASWDDAWRQLLDIPWVRPRANRHHVTLHDALAEELALRIIPLHDLDQAWRRGLWTKAAGIYTRLTQGPDEELDEKLADLDRRLQLAVGRSLPPEQAGALVEEVIGLDTRKRRLDQLRAARLYYEILDDFEKGSREFLSLFDKAARTHDVLFQELVVLEMQRFLPNGIDLASFGDVIRARIIDYHRWLSSKKPGIFLEIGLRTAAYLVETEQAEIAIELLGKLPEDEADEDQRYGLSNHRGNAWMRIPGRVRESESHFLQALADATALTAPDRERRIAEAHKELGFYYRNVGLWREADEAYRKAAHVISATLTSESTEDDREEMASIHTNWAYVKALRGSYREAQNLVESAISVQRSLGRTRRLGISLSVCGELYRYDRKFQRAWKAYEEARIIFETLSNWSWLGLVYQEQAICLFQAVQEGIELPDVDNPVGQARRRITWALDLCRDQAVRGYPSALNRAGRIFGATDHQAGLEYLEQGIDQALQVVDGWFWFANLIEYVELSYHAWRETEQPEHLDRILQRASTIEEATNDYGFEDLKGRWQLLKGHLAIHEGRLDDALQNYKDGFALIDEGYVGSHGAAAIPSEFRRFQALFEKLDSEVQRQWYEELHRAWSDLEHGDTSLLARLEELYVGVQWPQPHPPREG